MNQFLPENYKKFFTTGWRLTGLNASFLMGGTYAKANILITSRANAGDTFIQKSKEVNCLKAGVKLFGHKEKYDQYMADFQNYVRESEQTVVKKYQVKRKSLTRKEVEIDLYTIGKLWYYYGMLEFPYMDMAYEIAERENNGSMRERLNEASRYKFRARELMNQYFFDGGTMENLSSSIAEQFHFDSSETLFIDEMLGLFDGNRLTDTIVRQRKECYAVTIVGGTINEYSSRQAARYL